MTTEHELEFSYDLIKGRIAEAIVTELFTLSGYEVYPYGIEHIAPNVARYGGKGDVAALLRKSPDLLVRAPDATLHMIEVKYRGRGATDLRVDEYLAENRYADSFLIVLGGGKIVCATVHELKARRQLVPLVQRREFTFEKGLITHALRWSSEFLDRGRKKATNRASVRGTS